MVFQKMVGKHGNFPDRLMNEYFVPTPFLGLIIMETFIIIVLRQMTMMISGVMFLKQKKLVLIGMVALLHKEVINNGCK